MMKRREFFGIAAAAPAAALTNLNGVKSRQVSKWEIIYKSPHAKPNDLSMTREGMWVLDQGRDSWVSLVNVADGKVIREFKTDVNAASGVSVDEHGVMWISSTHNSLMVSCSSKDGKTIAKYWTPGAGRIYQKKGDAKPRSSKLKPAYPAEPSQAGSGSGAKSDLPYGQLPPDTQDGNGGTGAHGIVAKDGLLYFVVPPARFLIYQKKGDAKPRSSKLKPAYPAEPSQAGSGSGAKSDLPYGQLPPDTQDGNGGTGAHGIVAKDGLLYFVVPPARFLVVMEPKTWVVQRTWPVPGNRTHGLTWDENRETLWNADSNLNAFFRFDMGGKIIEKIQLTDDSPVIHGATLHEGYMLCCDDVGWIWRFRM